MYVCCLFCRLEAAEYIHDDSYRSAHHDGRHIQQQETETGQSHLEFHANDRQRIALHARICRSETRIEMRDQIKMRDHIKIVNSFQSILPPFASGSVLYHKCLFNIHIV